MNNLKIIKIVSVILAAVILISSVSPRIVSANEYSISGIWTKGKNKLYIDDEDMTISVRDINYYKPWCWCDGFEPSDVDENVYWIVFHDKINTTSGYFKAHVKGKKMKLKWSGGDKEYKCLKGTWKRKSKKWTENLHLSEYY